MPLRMVGKTPNWTSYPYMMLELQEPIQSLETKEQVIKKWKESNFSSSSL